MRVFANLANNDIIGTGSEPEVGGVTTVNGQYVVTYPQGVAVDVESASYLVPQDASSIGAQAAAEFLIRYPMYDHVLYSFFLETSDLQGTAPLGGGLDTSASAPSPAVVNDPTYGSQGPSALGPRCQVGRHAAAPVGIAPGSIAILNSAPNTSSNALYGNIVTGTWDITQAPVSSTGMDECLVWWKVSHMDDTADIQSGYEITEGVNTPALRQQTETVNEIAGLYVYASNDDGATWYRTQYMEPVDLVTAGTDLRLVFVNTTNQKIYLHGYCVMFSNIVP